MRLSFRLAAAGFAVTSILAVVPVSARMRAEVQPKAASNLSDVTWGPYENIRVYLPGKWTAAKKDTGVEFTKTKTTSVSLTTVPKDMCAYQTIRIRVLNSWGGERLQQSQSKIQTVRVGRSNYGGYSWMEPGAGGTDSYWCLHQDAKTAVEVKAVGIDAATSAFIKANLMLQLGVRSSRR